MALLTSRLFCDRSVRIVEQGGKQTHVRVLPVTAPEISHVAVNSPKGRHAVFFQLSNGCLQQLVAIDPLPDIDVNTTLFIGRSPAAPNFVVSAVFHRFSAPDRGPQILGGYVLSPKRFSMCF